MTTVLDLDANDTSGFVNNSCDDLENSITIRIRVERVLKVLLCIVATLIVTGTAANFVTYHVVTPEHKIAKLMNRFDINFEPSIPAWYSACALLASSALLSITGLAKMHEKDRYYKHWLVLAAIFMGLSIDEAARFHEMIHTVIISRVEVHGMLYFPWVVPALIFVGIVALCYIPFLLHIDRRTAKLFLVAGAIYVMGAVGMEIIAGPFAEKYGTASTPHEICEAIEETLEMLGIVAFIYALLDHFARVVKPIRFQVTSGAQQYAG